MLQDLDRLCYLESLTLLLRGIYGEILIASAL